MTPRRIAFATSALDPDLMELEAIDPFLYLGYGEGAPERFAAALHDCVMRGT